jgi:hypothetical protein
VARTTVNRLHIHRTYAQAATRPQICAQQSCLAEQLGRHAVPVDLENNTIELAAPLLDPPS